jgi:hypothetical protein
LPKVGLGQAASLKKCNLTIASIQGWVLLEYLLWTFGHAPRPTVRDQLEFITRSSIGYAGVSSKGLLQYLLLTFKCARQRRDASPQGNTLMPVASRSGRRGKT